MTDTQIAKITGKIVLRNWPSERIQREHYHFRSRRLQ